MQGRTGATVTVNGVVHRQHPSEGPASYAVVLEVPGEEPVVSFHEDRALAVAWAARLAHRLRRDGVEGCKVRAVSVEG